MKSRFLFWVGCSLVLSTATSALAAEVPCGPADKGTVSVDGLTDDWSDVPGVDGGGQDGNASFTMKCNVIEDRTLALLIDVRDNYFVRTAKAAGGEDHLELTLGSKRWTIFPGDAAKIKEKVIPPQKGMQIASALQAKGWAIEIMMPLSQVPGWKPGSPSISLGVKFLDCDSKAALKTERSAEIQGSIVFAQSDEALTAFLQDRGLQRSAVFWDKAMALGKKSGARAILAGRYLAVLSDGFLFMELPFKDRKDLHEVKLVDLAGDGRDAVVLRYQERGSGGAREVLAVYRPVGDSQIARVFACEIGKSSGNNKVSDKVSFVKRGRATDIVIEPAGATGFSQATYQEAPAEDMVPILLPWGDDKKARYQFSGDEYRRAQ